MSDKPNIILILADDMGYSDLGCYGAEIHTPHLDSMAAEGMRFSQMYNAARCCPSRACLLTGLYPHQAGVGHMVDDLGLPAYQGRLRHNTPTIAEVLKPAGYRSTIAGKWHVGGHFSRLDSSDWRTDDPLRPLPLDRGFDEWYGTPAGAGSYFNPKPLIHNRAITEPEDENYYYTEAVTDHAVRMIGESAAANEPFFLYLAYTAPHWPLHAPAEDIARYEGRYRGGWDTLRTARHEELKGMGILNERWPISSRDPEAPPWTEAPHPDWQQRRMEVYAAMIENMDRNIGRVRAALAQHGIGDNTLVIFISDNGGCAEFLREDGIREREWRTTIDGRLVQFGNQPQIAPGGPTTFQSYGLPWANASNSPFRRFKRWVHEGGISTPMIASWPGVIPAGSINHSVGHILDLLPTFMQMSGAAYPAQFGGADTPPLQGQSLLPALRGEDWERDGVLYWEHEGHQAVRDGRWKLVREDGQPWELYDMVEDRTELHDLAEKDKPRAARMAAQYDHWADQLGILPAEKLWAHWREAHKK